LLALAARDRQNEASNSFFVSQQQLREDTALAISTIGKKLQLLEDGGYITRTRRTYERGARKGQRASDNITLHLEKPRDPDLDAGEQPHALRKANKGRAKGVSVSKDSVQVSDEDRREGWEQSLDETWNEFPTWWDNSADTTAPLVIQDALSGEVVANRGPFTSAQRPKARRRPIEIWDKKDAILEFGNRIRWVDPDNQSDFDAILDGFHLTGIRESEFMPAKAVSAVARLFEDEEFLNIVVRDSGEAGVIILKELAKVHGKDDFLKTEPVTLIQTARD
jgi:hypothetical protein